MHSAPHALTQTLQLAFGVLDIQSAITHDEVDEDFDYDYDGYDIEQWVIIDVPRPMQLAVLDAITNRRSYRGSEAVIGHVFAPGSRVYIAGGRRAIPTPTEGDYQELRVGYDAILTEAIRQLPCQLHLTIYGATPGAVVSAELRCAHERWVISNIIASDFLLRRCNTTRALGTRDLLVPLRPHRAALVR